MCSSVVGSLTRTFTNRLLKRRSPNINYSLLSTFGHRCTENNNNLRHCHTQPQDDNPRKHKLEFAKVKRAFMFTRSISPRTFDGIVLQVKDDEVVFEFGRDVWICKVPHENKVYYNEGSHVRGMKFIPGENEPLPPTVVVITEYSEMELDDLPQFPFMLTRVEKIVLLSIGGLGAACLAILVVFCVIIFVCDLLMFDAGTMIQPERPADQKDYPRPKR